jgi:prostaglandin-endoperoxide synthase 2
MSGERSTAKDGVGNRLEFYLLTHFGPLWRLIQRNGPLRRQVNRVLINRAIKRVPARPHPLTTLAPYTSWASLTDRTFAARHLPPAVPPDPPLPPEDQTADLFERREEVSCDKSTVLFAHFAQWFTDGFLRGDHAEKPDPRKTSSNHEVDLCQLYGLRPEVTHQLRTFRGGRLKSQIINREEYPPYLCRDGVVRPEFDRLEVVRFGTLSTEQRNGLFAMGGDRTNSTTGFSMLNVLFLREHNRLARVLEADNPEWDDERLFGTARNILTVMLIKIVIEEYINHITPYHFEFSLDPTGVGKQPWYRTNWMAIEFNLLYRWHSLVPSTLRIAGDDVPVYATLFNNDLLTKRGLGPLFEDASRQPAGRVGLFNTDHVLRETEIQSLSSGRTVQLRSYNDYRAYCGYPRVTAFDQITGDPAVQSALEKHYGSVDRVEFYTGVFAEDVRADSALPPLIGRFVGVDAFSQVLTNPLLAPRVYGEATLSPLGMRLIDETRNLSDLLHRNLPEGGRRHLVTMTRPDWRRAR